MSIQRQSIYGEEISAAVYGREGDFVLIVLPFGALSLLALEYVAANALPFCGTLGFVHGECQAKSEKNAEAVSVLMDAVIPFARYVCSKIKGTDTARALYRPEAWKELT